MTHKYYICIDTNFIKLSKSESQCNKYDIFSFPTNNCKGFNFKVHVKPVLAVCKETNKHVCLISEFKDIIYTTKKHKYWFSEYVHVFPDPLSLEPNQF